MQPTRTITAQTWPHICILTQLAPLACVSLAEVAIVGVGVRAGFGCNLVGFSKMMQFLKDGADFAARGAQSARDSVAGISATIKRALFASQRGASAPAAPRGLGNAVAPLLDDADAPFGISIRPSAATALQEQASAAGAQPNSAHAPDARLTQPRLRAEGTQAAALSVYDSSQAQGWDDWPLPRRSNAYSSDGGVPVTTQRRVRLAPTSAPGGLAGRGADGLTGRPVFGATDTRCSLASASDLD